MSHALHRSPAHACVNFNSDIVLSRMHLPVRVLAAVLSGLLALACAAQRKVLIIGIDGCRPDALVAADAPTIDSLMATGVYTLEGITHPPTWSGTGWSSMLTGVWEQKHGVKDNTFAGSNFTDWPHFLDRLKAQYPSMSFASIVHWAPINAQILQNADLEQSFATDAQVAAAAVDLLANGDPDVLFVHFDDVDAAGHAHGHDPAVPQYLAAIATIDTLVDQVVAALTTRPPAEEWAVILSTDHGGNGAGHGGIAHEEQRIFTIVSSPWVPQVELPAVMDTVPMGATVAFNSSGHAQASSTVGLQFGSAQDFTLECRVKMPATWSGDPVMVSNKNWASGTNPGYVISTPSGGPAWKINVGDGADRVDLTGLPINDGQWHHLAMTCDRDGKVRIFQDGLFLRETGMTAIGNVNTALQINIGQDGTGAYSSAFPGSIAEVRIWNAALSIKTVSAWSGKPLSPSHPNWSSLKAHWEMDEGSGSAFANSVGGGSGAIWIGSSPAWQPAGGECIATDLSLTPTQVDLPPTVVHFLGLPLNPGWDLDGRSLIPITGPVSIDLRTLLQGPYDGGTLLMRDDLRYAGLVPPDEPYTALGFNLWGGGGEHIPSIVLERTGPGAVVDWIIVDARGSADSSQVIASRCGLIRRDGRVVDVDGTSPLVLPVPPGPYFISVRHRGHLGVMTAAAIPFAMNVPAVVDLSSPLQPLYGTDAMLSVGGRRVQWAGEIKHDGVIKYTGSGNDRDRILLAIGGAVPTATLADYRSEDLTMDGLVKYTGYMNDRDLILLNIGGAVPTAVRLEQLPH